MDYSWIVYLTYYPCYQIIYKCSDLAAFGHGLFNHLEKLGTELNYFLTYNPPLASIVDAEVFQGQLPSPFITVLPPWDLSVGIMLEGSSHRLKDVILLPLHPDNLLVSWATLQWIHLTYRIHVPICEINRMCRIGDQLRIADSFP